MYHNFHYIFNKIRFIFMGLIIFITKNLFIIDINIFVIFDNYFCCFLTSLLTLEPIRVSIWLLLRRKYSGLIKPTEFVGS